MLLLNGYGGMGKTTLASYYYHTYQKLYKNVGWVFNDKGICDALLKLSIALKVEYEDRMQKEERLEKLLRAMAKLDKPCLLIIDNVDDMKELRDNYQYLSRCSNFHILITTRVSEFNFVKIYRIDGLGEEKARELFQKYYKIGNDNENLKLFQKLYRAVGGNTLVIELIAKNLYWLNRYNTYTLSSLLDDLQKKGLLDIKNSQNVSSTYHTDCVVTKEPKAIIEGIYDLNELQVNEVLLLSVLSVLPAESIEYEILQSLIGSREDICENLDLLSQKGWIEYNQESKSVQCNPLIQEITRQKREDTLFDDCRELIASLIYKLEYEPGTGHCINTTYQKAAIYAAYAECAAQFFKNTGGRIGILFERLGNYYSAVGNSLKALELFEEYTKLKKELYEADPNNVSFKNGLAISYSKLGETHTTLGNLKKALELFEEYTKLKKELYESDPNNVSFKNGLAISYAKLGVFFKDSRKDVNMARIYFLKAEDLWVELVRDAPDYIEFSRYLERVREDLKSVGDNSFKSRLINFGHTLFK